MNGTAGIPAVKSFVALARKRQEIKAELDKVEGQMDELETALIHAFSELGVQNITCDGMVAYIHKQVWARPADNAAATVRVLLEAGMEDYVVLGNQKTSTLFRGDNVDSLPPEIVAAFQTEEKVSIRCRKAT